MEINVKWIISSVVEADSVQEAMLSITDTAVNEQLRLVVEGVTGGQDTTIITEVEGADLSS